MPSFCSVLCCLGAGSGIFSGLSVSQDLLGDLIGDSAGATLPDISAKMAIISESETVVAMVFSSERTVDQLIAQDRFRNQTIGSFVSCFIFKELTVRASADSEVQVCFYSAY